MHIRLAFTGVLCGLILSSCGQDTETNEVSAPKETNTDVVMAAFSSSDSNQDGIIDADEVSAMANSMFLSMDYDDNQSVTFKEFQLWDFGLASTSEGEGQSVEFETGKRILFAIQDLDANGQMSAEEHLESLELGFARADRDESGAMSMEELASGFLPSIIFRAALEETLAPQSAQQ